MMTPLERKDILLRAAYDLLKTAEINHYVEQATAIVVHYDDANCDGFCLLEDIAESLGIDTETPPIPLSDEQK